MMDGTVSKRKREITSKLKDYVVGNPLGYCPGCNLYVEPTEKGIECTTCVAYWHYSCANISDEEAEKFRRKDFYCEKHREVALEKQTVSASTVCGVAKDEMGVKLRTSQEVINAGNVEIINADNDDDLD